MKEKASRSWRVLRYAVAGIVALVLFWFGCTCVVREGSCALILRFGAVREEITQAGVSLKLPWPFETVVTYDSRTQYLKSQRLETTTKDKRNIILQSYVVWKIADPVLYHNSVGLTGAVDTYLNDQVFSATNSTLGAYPLEALVSTDMEAIRMEEIQQEIFARVRESCRRSYGIQVVDVSIMTLSLPTNNLNSIFEQMTADRRKAIDTILASAKTQANKIETDAQAQAAEIKAAGVTQAAEIDAQAEKEVARIYAEAQSANLSLYRFLMDLDTMVASVQGPNTVLVVETDEYPFSILKEYSEVMAPSSDAVALGDLNRILSQLEPRDRDALVNAITDLIRSTAQQEGILP